MGEDKEESGFLAIYPIATLKESSNEEQNITAHHFILEQAKDMYYQQAPSIVDLPQSHTVMTRIDF